MGTRNVRQLVEALNTLVTEGDTHTREAERAVRKNPDDAGAWQRLYAAVSRAGDAVVISGGGREYAVKGVSGDGEITTVRLDEPETEGRKFFTRQFHGENIRLMKVRASKEAPAGTAGPVPTRAEIDAGVYALWMRDAGTDQATSITDHSYRATLHRFSPAASEFREALSMRHYSDACTIFATAVLAHANPATVRQAAGHLARQFAPGNDEDDRESRTSTLDGIMHAFDQIRTAAAKPATGPTAG